MYMYIVYSTNLNPYASHAQAFTSKIVWFQILDMHTSCQHLSVTSVASYRVHMLHPVVPSCAMPIELWLDALSDKQYAMFCSKTDTPPAIAHKDFTQSAMGIHGP